MGRVLKTAEAEPLSVELIEAAKAGEKKAWRALVEATQTRLYRFCLVLCGDPVRAEDLCQEAYLKCFDKLSKLDQPSTFISWLFRVTRNLYIDQVRANREDATADMAETSANPEYAEAFAVHEALSHFEPEDRWLLVLVDMEGYSYKEAGGMVGISEDAVRSRLFRLRKEFVEKYNGRETK